MVHVSSVESLTAVFFFFSVDECISLTCFPLAVLPSISSFFLPLLVAHCLDFETVKEPWRDDEI